MDRQLYESEGELTPQLEAELEALDGAVEEKIERVALYIREQMAKADACYAEEKRLIARRLAYVKNTMALEEYLHRQMWALGKTRVNGLLCTVSVQENPPHIVGELDDLDLRGLAVSDPDAVTIKPATYSLARRVLLDRHKAGGALPAGLTVERESSIRIR